MTMNQPVKTDFKYSFDQAGNYSSATLSLSDYSNAPSTINTAIQLVPDDLDEGKTFDDYTMKQLEVIARQKIADWVTGKLNPKVYEATGTPTADQPTDGVTADTTPADGTEAK